MRGCKPPIEPRVASERIKTCGLVYQSLMRILSPSTAPKLKGEEGSTQSTAIFLPSFTSAFTKPSTNVLLPAPGGPVTPMIFVLEGFNDCNNSSYPGNSFSTRDIALAKIGRASCRENC